MRLAADSDRLHRYDARSRVLHVSSRLRPGQQAFRMATQVALLEYGEELDRLAAEDFPPDSPPTPWPGSASPTTSPPR